MRNPSVFFVAVLLSIVAPLYSQTFLIDTWEQQSLENMELERRIRMVSAETGIMDSLFESGHIFFNVYSLPDEEGRIPQFSTSFDLATEIGAEYLIRLEPGDDGLSWSLFTSQDAREVSAGFTAVNEVDEELKDIERWTQIGSIVAQDIITSLR